MVDKHESDILKNAQNRTVHFRPNRKLEILIKEMVQLLGPVQDNVNQYHAKPNFPVIAVIGCPRSGTTFLTQLLVSTGAFCYPSNLLSRFAYAPYVGAKIQQLLFDQELDLGSEFCDLRSKSGFRSNVGKTEGALGINEFFHFWRRFLPIHDPGFLSETELEKVQTEQMRRELASLVYVFGKPFLSKAMMLQYNLAFFAEAIPELKFIYIKRDPVFLMQSLKQARIKYYGNEKFWFSLKPKEYEFLKYESPDVQIAGQVLFTHRAIKEQSVLVPENRFFQVDYEEVCVDPKNFLNALSGRFGIADLCADLSEIADSYPLGNQLRISQAEQLNLLKCYKKLEARVQ
jgi:hypothetical protein